MIYLNTRCDMTVIIINKKTTTSVKNIDNYISRLNTNWARAR